MIILSHFQKAMVDSICIIFFFTVSCFENEIDKYLRGAIKRVSGTADVDGAAVEGTPFTVFLQFT